MNSHTDTRAQVPALRHQQEKNVIYEVNSLVSTIHKSGVMRHTYPRFTKRYMLIRMQRIGRSGTSGQMKPVRKES